MRSELTSHQASPDTSKEKIAVPRDPDVDAIQSTRRDVMPSPDTINMPDADYPAANKPVVADSPIARELHDDPPQSYDQREVGCAGEAARPPKR